ncbi:ribosome small subunit-dependent GTPase A [Jeotgalibacillus haloalkalitolerans]|uniref:Small ribosomal subunit biogenesis GTPase RsgA n=1 Tax=Jeotgalibacillus haloalkalitolerans TaxID=3104292 RepID=A0ABU5KPZ3_9BACL|nr:ribosome small subunit-dependent GTPase A [Jeotgalibacillus sp. HH7-29]MDZ5713222.1 ribosome small subunit-dependent GTPase A [Jeotgalibacillus sp. HH7-29]
MNTLTKLGWNEKWQEKAGQTDLTPARIITEYKNLYKIQTDTSIHLAEVTGKYRHQASAREDYPAVGDWVMVSTPADEGHAMIHQVLERTSKFSRKVAGQLTNEQIVAANIDIAFLVMSLNHDFNLRRLERYLIAAWESGANPIVVLSKADLCENSTEKAAEAEAAAMGVPVLVTSAYNGTGLDELKSHISEGITVAVMGSSGVGKSSIINALIGEEKMTVNDIREDDSKGKHTTTHRELILLPDKGVIIDTPGMRELQLWESDSGLSQGFQDIETLAEACQFRDCSHETEPGCAIREAIEAGELEQDRYNSYVKLQKELAYLDRKSNKREQILEKKKWKKISQYQKQIHK